MASAMSTTVPTVTTVLVLGIAIVSLMFTCPALPSRRWLLNDRDRRLMRGRRLLVRRAVEDRAPLNDLVKLAAIEPNTSTLRAVVDLNPLSLCHDQRDPTGRAQQPRTLTLTNCRICFNHVHLLMNGGIARNAQSTARREIGSLAARGARGLRYFVQVVGGRAVVVSMRRHVELDRLACFN